MFFFIVWSDRRRRGGIRLQGGESKEEEVEEEEREDEEDKEEEEEEEESVKEEREKARIDEIWAAFKTDIGQKPLHSSDSSDPSGSGDTPKARWTSHIVSQKHIPQSISVHSMPVTNYLRSH